MVNNWKIKLKLVQREEIGAMEKNYYERRFNERFHYEGKASYMRMGDASNLPDTSYSTAEIVDISSGGSRLRLNQLMLKEGTLLITKVSLPGISATMPVIAKVQWVREESEKNYQAGIKFVLGN